MERSSASKPNQESTGENLDQTNTSSATSKKQNGIVSSEKINMRKITSETEDFIKDFTIEEKLEWMHQKRLKANRLHNKKRHEEAIHCYTEVIVAADSLGQESVNFLEFSSKKKRKSRLKNEILIPSMLNLAASLKEISEHSNALDICNKAIDLEPTYYKSYYRRGNIYQSQKEFDKALDDYLIARKYCNEEASLLMLKYSIEDLKTVQEKRKRAFRDLVEESSILNETDVEYSEAQDVESGDRQGGEDNKILKYNDELEELSKYGVLKYFVYPFKVVSKLIKEKVACCRRKRGNEETVSNAV